MSEATSIRGDLVLPPNTYAHVLDSTKGRVSVHVGPSKTSLSETDKVVRWDGERFIPTLNLESAIQTFVRANEGQYVILTAPVKGERSKFPPPGMINDALDLEVGRQIVIAGPATFPLWPGQQAQTIEGHHLRHNQYLVVRVYDPEAAQENASSAVIASQSGDEAGKDLTARSFTMGELMVIKGTDVSFYMPPTGIEVVPEDDTDVRNARSTTMARPGSFVREAATLEQLEYSVLRDENGQKRYERGPAVVFPEPTETFVLDENGSRKFRAIELNPQSGLYIKVIAPYEEDGTDHKEGEELFLTGDDSPIYFPRPEHWVIGYMSDGKERRKHHAIAIPAGEGRYVLDRTTGVIDLITGPDMFLPDPRTQVVVRRVLDHHVVDMMYPGNTEAMQINMEYARQRQENASQGYLGTQGAAPEALYASTDMLMATASLTDAPGGEQLRPRSASVTPDFGGEKLRRGSTYTPTRTITLDTKYDGAVGMAVWPGYAVLVMDKMGNRRVERGPVNFLLKYEESLMPLTLSTGRPKSVENPLKTVYLRTVNNAVGDEITVETRDLVPVTVEVSLRVDFEGEDPSKWFDVEDYVALLTDHCRSKLRNAAKRHGIQEFYSDTIDIIRDALLGVSEDGERTGLPFAENGMRLYDVEVLSVQIEHPDVERLLSDAQGNALEGAIQLSEAKDQRERDTELEVLKRAAVEDQEMTAAVVARAELDRLRRTITHYLEETANNQQLAEEQEKIAALKRSTTLLDTRVVHTLHRETNEIELEHLTGEVEQFVKRMSSISPAYIEALNHFGDQTFVEKVVTAVGPAAFASGATTGDILARTFEGTPAGDMIEKLTNRPLAVGNGGGRSTERAAE